MSTDYYLYSPKRKKAVMIGSVGFSGSKSWPVEYGGREFIQWMLDELVDDVVVVNEHYLDEIEDVNDITKFIPREQRIGPFE